MLRFLRRCGVALLSIMFVLFCIFWAVTLIATVGYVLRFNDSVTLPNGMILRREFDLRWRERGAMFASDGETLLARDIEFVCFNDRYVHVIAYRTGVGGLFDSQTGRRVPPDAFDEAYDASGLGDGGPGCNGYYTGMVGPGLLYDGLHSPFLPSCAWRNLDNPTLEDRFWFDRPCDDG